MPHHSHQTELDRQVGMGRFDGFEETLQVVDEGNKDALQAMVIEYSHDPKPELSTHSLGDPRARHFVLLGQVEPIAK